MRKSNFGMLTEFMLAAAVVTIVAILIFNVNADAREDLYVLSATCNETSGILTGCSDGYTATISSDAAIAKVPSNLSLLGTAIVFGVILYVILRVIPTNANGSGF